MKQVKSVVLLGAFVAAQTVSASLTVIPYPQHVTEKEGVFALRTAKVAKTDVTWKTDAAIPSEGYRLSVTPTGVTAWSSDDAGAFYALQTLKQMARPQEKTIEVEVTEVLQGSIRLPQPRKVKRRIRPLEIPCCEIEDAPRFRYRGFMLDEARHFMGKEVVKKYLDLMSEAKMNVFHWHLTDDEGWRLELKCHPEVHEKGSVRPQSMCHGSDGDNLYWNGEKYGPFFYTHEEVKEIVAYAAARHIEVIPEIDVPAHSRALFVSHPEFTCIGPNETFAHPWMIIGPQYECFCAANEDGMKFIEDILAEVCELFPSKRVHIGGDECPPNRWQECPKCQALMKRLGIAKENAGALQTRMTHRFAKFLAARGKEAIAWDEVLSKDMPENLILQLWRDGNDGRLAAEAGMDVIMSPSDRTYFTRPQDIPDDPHQTTAGKGASITLKAAFDWDPCLGLAPEAAKRVRGVECCSWAECTWGWFDLNWKMWPRSFATAEVAWTGPRTTDFEDFLRRVAPLRRRLIDQHVGAAPITVHRDDRIVAAEGYDKPASWKPNDLGGLGFLCGSSPRIWDFLTDEGRREAPDWAMCRNIWFECNAAMRLAKWDFNFNVVPEEKKYRGPRPIRFEDVIGEKLEASISRFEKARPGNPVAFALHGPRPVYLLGDFYEKLEDVAGFNAWRARHPSFYAFGAYDEYDCDFGGYMWKAPLITNLAVKAEVTRLYPLYEDRHLMSGAGWTATSKRLEESYHFGCTDLFGLYSVGLTTGHDLAQVGCKYLWYESELGSTSSPWRWGGMFVRGAGRQFGMNWGWYTANYFQGFTRDGESKDGFMHWPGPLNNQHDRYLGCSRSLTHRNNAYGYLIGASANLIEGGSHALFADNTDDPKAPKLSPIGEDYESIFRWDQAHERGTTYSPVAFLLSIDQPVNRQFFTPASHKVTDKFSAAAFLNTLVPTYEPDTALYSRRREGDQGCLFNSPFGEIADTLCPDADQDDGKFLAALSDYKAAFLIGEYSPKYIKAKALAEYVKNGGTLFVSADQVHEGVVPADLAGVSFDGTKTPCYEAVMNEKGLRIFQIYRCDGVYTLYAGKVSTAKPFLTDGRGRPATWVNAYGKGRVYTVACRRMMPDEYADTGNYFERLKPFASGLRIFPFIRYLLGRVQDDVMPITVTGDIQWGLNKVESKKEKGKSDGWLLWMINNRGCRKFWGEPEEVDPKAVSRVVVNLKTLKGAKVTELTSSGTAGELKVDGDILTVDVAPCAVRTFAIE